MPALISDGFQHPLGDGSVTEAHDADAFFVPNDTEVYDGGNFGARLSPSSYDTWHLGEDWNGEGNPEANPLTPVPVFAASNGEVTQSGILGSSSTVGLGEYIVIRHDLPPGSEITEDGITTSTIYTLYAHLGWGSRQVEVGAPVARGDQIGVIGNSGGSGGSYHLHFEVRLGSDFTSIYGYNEGHFDPVGWVDPTDFIVKYENFGKPDLIIQNVTVADSSVAYGDYMTVTYDVVNIGDAAAQDHFTRFVFSEDATLNTDDVSTLDTIGTSLAPGESIRITSVIPTAIVSEAGSYNLIVVADHTNSIAESDEENNEASPVAIEIFGGTGGGGPDLEPDGRIGIGIRNDPTQGATLKEGDHGNTTGFDFEVYATSAVPSPTPPNSGTIRVNWNVTGDGTNKVTSSDFYGGIYASGTETFYPGDTVRRISVDFVGDDLPEFDESFNISISIDSADSDEAYVLGGEGIAFGTLSNDDGFISADDDYGDDFANAHVIPLDPNAPAGQIGTPNDKDVFTAYLLKDVPYEIIFGGSNPASDRLDGGVIKVFDESGVEFAFSDISPDPNEYVFQFTPDNYGRYYFEMSSLNGDSTGNYYFRFYVDGKNIDGRLTAIDPLVRALSVDDVRHVFGAIGSSVDVNTISFRTDRNFKNYDITLYGQNGDEILGAWSSVASGVYNFDFISQTGDNYLLEVEALNKEAYGEYSVNWLFQGQFLDPLDLEFSGDAGNDDVVGNGLDNTLSGEGGIDTLTGGDGLDRFVIARGPHSATVTDFIDGEDLIDLSRYRPVDALAAVAAARDVSGDAVLDLYDGGQVILTGFDVTKFSAADVVLGDPSSVTGGFEKAISEVDASTSGSIAISDPLADTPPTFANASAVGVYGAIEVNPVGDQWTYTRNGTSLQALDAGDVEIDTIILSASDGSLTQISITIDGVDDPAVVSGDLAAYMSDTDVVLSGAISISDPDEDDTPSFAGASAVGTYGTLALNGAGTQWTYVRNGFSLEQLSSGQEVLDRLTITASDGTAQDIDVVIVGEDPFTPPPSPKAIGEILQLTVGTSWQTLTFANTYTDAVVFALSPSLNEVDAAATRFKNITGTGAEILLQEPKKTVGGLANTSDHADETVTLLVLEKGTHFLEDGTVIQVGEVETNKLYVKGFETIEFADDFDTTPSIFSQVQTINGTDFITSRQRNPDGSGFQLTMQEEQADNRNHATETVGWFAIEHGSGTLSEMDWQAGASTRKVNGNLTNVAFDEAFDAAPLLVASLASYNGTDPASPRLGTVTETGFKVMVLEDQSLDDETQHGHEIIDWIGFSAAGTLYEGEAPAVAPGRMIAASGFAVANDKTVTVDIGTAFDNPVVIATMTSRNGTQEAVARVSNVTATSFDVRIQETDALDGNHGAEDISWIVVEAGIWQLADGTFIQAGLDDIGSTTRQGFASINFAASFTADPAVLTQTQTETDAAFVKTRMTGVDATGFDVALEEEEAESWGSHGTETVGWIAVDMGLASDVDGFVFEAGETSTNHNWKAETFTGAFDVAPGLVAGMATYTYNDTAGTRIKALSDTGFEIHVEEDTSLNPETSHGSETFHWVAFNGEGELWGDAIV